MTWWTDLKDAFRFSRPGIDPSGASILTTTYGMGPNEGILGNVASSARDAYTGNSVVFGAILARMSLFSEATFAFMSLDDNSLSGSYVQDGRKNTALHKLEAPGPNRSTGDLLCRMMQDADLAGNAYIWDTGDELVRLRPDWVTIVSEFRFDALGRQYRTVVGYFYDPPPTSQEGPPQMFDVSEIAHWAPIPDPNASFRGMSWLTPVFRDIIADDAMTSYKIKYLDNAASPNLLVKYSQKIGKTTVQRISDQIADRHGGVDNAFKTLVLDEGADVTVIGNSFEQMNFSTVQAAGENRIIIASGVPGIVIGSKEGLMAATYSNYAQAMRRFADITMRPLWRSACDCLSVLVVVPPGNRLWINVAGIAALRQGEKEQADTTLVKAQAAAALAKEGYEPLSAAKAVEAGDLSLLKYIDKPPETKLDTNVLAANPQMNPKIPALNGATTPLVPIGAGK